jgi:hypothetical protein
MTVAVIPSPHAIAKQANNRRHACDLKQSYETQAVAFDIGRLRMATSCPDPLYVYPCPHCVGFHLTSHPGQDAVPVPAAIEPGVMTSSQSPRGGMNHHDRSLMRRRVEPEPVEGSVEILPLPHVASDDEAQAFFARALAVSAA